MTTCGVDNGTALSFSAGLRKSAPRTAAMRNPAVSTVQSRPVLGRGVSGWAGSTGASSEAGTSCSSHRLPRRYMTRA